MYLQTNGNDILKKYYITKVIAAPINGYLAKSNTPPRGEHCRVKEKTRNSKLKECELESINSKKKME